MDGKSFTQSVSFRRQSYHLYLSLWTLGECLLVRQGNCEAQVGKLRLDKVKNVSIKFGLANS